MQVLRGQHFYVHLPGSQTCILHFSDHALLQGRAMACFSLANTQDAERLLLRDANRITQRQAAEFGNTEWVTLAAGWLVTSAPCH